MEKKVRLPFAMGLLACAVIGAAGSVYSSLKTITLSEEVISLEERVMVSEFQKDFLFNLLSARHQIENGDIAGVYFHISKTLGHTPSNTKVEYTDMKRVMDKFIDRYVTSDDYFGVIRGISNTLHEYRLRSMADEMLISSFQIGMPGVDFDQKKFKKHLFMVYSLENKRADSIASLHNKVRSLYKDKHYGNRVCYFGEDGRECVSTVLFDEREAVDHYLNQVEVMMSYIDNDIENRLNAKLADGKEAKGL